MDYKRKIDIPFGANDSELKGWEYTIPDGMEAEIKDGKVVVRQKENEDERIGKRLIKLLQAGGYLEEPDRSAAFAWLARKIEQKQEWSEEDEEMIVRICANLEYLVKEAGCDSKLKEKLEERIKWMKRLKSLRLQPKAEWTDADEQHLKWLCRIIHSRKNHGELSLAEESELCNWIDKWINHNPQPHWKPSDEQMEALKRVYYNRPIGSAELNSLELLYNDLKKLI